jgi:hypothetical protein
MFGTKSAIHHGTLAGQSTKACVPLVKYPYSHSAVPMVTMLHPATHIRAILCFPALLSIARSKFHVAKSRRFRFAIGGVVNLELVMDSQAAPNQLAIKMGILVTVFAWFTMMAAFLFGALSA